jgi:hypothetical protein
MKTTQKVTWLTEEIADFLATCPTSDQMLKFRPSKHVQQRAQDLLRKSKEGQISSEEHWELDQFEHAEMLMQLVKARLRVMDQGRFPR